MSLQAIRHEFRYNSTWIPTRSQVPTSSSSSLTPNRQRIFTNPTPSTRKSTTSASTAASSATQPRTTTVCTSRKSSVSSRTNIFSPIRKLDPYLKQPIHSVHVPSRNPLTECTSSFRVRKTTATRSSGGDALQSLRQHRGPSRTTKTPGV